MPKRLGTSKPFPAFSLGLPRVVKLGDEIGVLTGSQAVCGSGRQGVEREKPKPRIEQHWSQLSQDETDEVVEIVVELLIEAIRNQSQGKLPDKRLGSKPRTNVIRAPHER